MKIIFNRSLPFNAKTQSRRDKRSTQVTPLDFSAAWRAGFSALDSIRVALLATAVVLLPAAAQADGAIEAWVQRHNGPANIADFVYAMAVDTGGNVYVTGSSAGSDLSSDYATIKYSGAGVPLWTNLYNGPVNGYDEAYAVAVDGGGNVVVTGFSAGSGGTGNCATIKYASDGVPVWTNLYSNNGGWAVAVDASSNVFVMAQSISGGNCVTLKYSNAGALLWARTYSYGGGWPSAMAVDADGNVFVTGALSDGWLTLKYSSAGTFLWAKTYDAGRPYALATDASGNVVATGRSSNAAGISDSLTIKYSSAGVPVWTNLYNGPANSDDEAAAVAVDTSGNVVVTGWSGGVGTSGDYATIKYSGAGVPLWTNRYNGPANGGDGAVAIAVDANGNAFVTGESAGTGSGPDYGTVAYSSGGVPLWTNRYNGTGSDRDWAKAVAVDASGGVYVAGSSVGSGTDFDFATVKYVAPPIIIRQPLSCTNAVGTAANFSVEVAGGLPLSYQWRWQGTNLSDGVKFAGVTTTNLQIANVQLTDAAAYTVVVTNAHGSVTSIVAQLTVTIPPNPGRFTDLSYSKATGFSCIFRDGTLGQTYRIQRSPSLAEGSWTNWQTFTYTEPVGLMDVAATGAERRYYRAISP
jgi:hypothetical protein